MRSLASLLLVFVAVASVTATIYFKEDFDASYSSRWVDSKAREDYGSFIRSAGKFHGADEEAAMGLQTSQDARFYAASAKFPAFSNEGKDLVIQLRVKHEQNIDCGGGYVKVLFSDVDQEKFDGSTDYAIMFGPDICGFSSKKVHVIFGHKGTNYLIKKDITCETDVLSHFYTLIVSPDNTYRVLIDGTEKAAGSLEEDWDILPPKEIADPAVSQPADWVTEAMMDDPEDVKPAGWDDIPATIVDEEAEQPADWDEEEDGVWERPTVPNPEYQGEWRAKRIANPDYKGPWKAPMIPNPDYAPNPTLYAYENIGAIGIDIWQVKSGTVFDSILVGNSLEEATADAEKFDREGESETKQAADAEAAENAQAERDAQAAREAAEGDDAEEEENEHDEL